MPTREQIINFGPGPAALPTPVLEQASKDIFNYNDLGMSLAEISHRSGTANSIMANANSHLRELLSIPDTHEVIWQQGGGTAQFSMVMYNLAAAYVQRGGNVKEMTTDYLITGGWSKKVYEEAVRLGLGKVNVVTDSRKYNGGKFGLIPAEKDWTFTPKEKCAYVYYCDNETVDGVEFPGFLQSLDHNVPVVCDMSSNILSRKVDVSKFAVIYAGAQKNVGIPGITILIVRKDILDRADANVMKQHGLPPVPVVFDYLITHQNNSLYNTLPIFSVHIADLVFQHLISHGGIVAQEQRNAEKANLLYTVLERAEKEGKLDLVVQHGVRSRMNVPFKFKSKDIDAEFVKEAEKMGMMQLKGHRSVGGIRASLYNAITVENTKVLVAFLEEFLKKL